MPGSCKSKDGTDCTVFTVPRAACTTYEVHVERNGVIYNEVPLVNGHAKLGCTLEDGTMVTAVLAFTGC